MNWFFRTSSLMLVLLILVVSFSVFVSAEEDEIIKYDVGCVIITNPRQCNSFMSPLMEFLSATEV